MACYTPVYRCALVREGSIPTEPRLTSPDKARAVANAYLADSPNEQLLAILLDTKHQVIGASVITVGILDASLVHPRESFRAAILANASAIVIAHNHPSGDLTPSSADWQVYRRLRDAGELLGISVLDSIIVDGIGNSLSMREEQL